MLRLKYAFILMFFVYCIGLLAGYLVFQYIDFQMPPGVVSSFGFVDFLTDKQRLLLNIIVHNLVVSLKIVLLGCFSLGILGGCILFYNGVVHGFCFSVALQSLGLVGFVFHLLPHSLELMGLVMSAHLGMLLSYKILLGKSSITFSCILKYGIVILIVLFVSSIWEVYVSIH